MEAHRQTIRELVHDLKYTYGQVRSHLIEDLGLPYHGLSERSIRRFCKKHDIGKTCHRLPVDARDEVSRVEYELAGPDCGRTLVHGRVLAHGYHIGQVEVGRSLKRIDPVGTEERYRGLRDQTNPPLYKADYTGQKLHFDQNEKMVMFGVTHVVGADGYSRMVVGHSTMPVKCNKIIYEDIYRPAVLTHGVWDTLRLDGGQEFNLIEFAQIKYGRFRFNQRRPCVSRGKSTQNHIVERVWPDINRLVNYPLKRVLVDMWHRDEFDLNDGRDKYLVSALTRPMSSRNLARHVQGWNHRLIERRGFPYQLVRQTGQHLGRCPMAPNYMPLANEMADLYTQETGGSVKEFPKFGDNPFDSQAAEQEWFRRLELVYPDCDLIWKAANQKLSNTVANYYITAFNLADQIIR